jgi:hypothetical protein
MPQTEFISPVSVLDDLGAPQNFGWSRQPGFFYDPALVRASRRYISESDRYIVHCSSHMVILEVRDDGYSGYAGVSIISLKDKKRSSHQYHTAFPLGAYDMPPGSEFGTIRYKNKKNSMDFAPRDKGVRIIRIDIPKFGHNRSLRGELVLTEPAPAESLITNMSWPNEKNAFRYSRCSPWYTVEGVIQHGALEIIFTRSNAWGVLDWNRGVRPRSDIRYWAYACGLSGEHLIGFCIGYGSEDSQSCTENAFFIDGRLHKLDQVTFNIPPADWLSPWRFTSNDNRLEMTFSPHQERVERSRFLLFSSSRRQVCGFFSGRAILDDGAAIEFSGITGFAERHKRRL